MVMLLRRIDGAKQIYSFTPSVLYFFLATFFVVGVLQKGERGAEITLHQPKRLKATIKKTGLEINPGLRKKLIVSDMADHQSPATKFLIASVSSMTAATITNPIDVIKIRLQLQGELAEKSIDLKYKGFIRGGLRILKEEGIGGLGKGITASLLREGFYSGIRLGAYEPFKELFGATDPTNTPLWKKIAAGGCSGAIGSCIANPADLIKVRMQADISGTRFASTAAAFAEVWRSEGLAGLYRGVGPTTKRAAILTATQIPSYDHTKHTILNNGWMGEGLPLHILSSILAGFNSAVVTSPIDVVKTRVMNQPIVDGKPSLYAGTLDCFRKVVAAEGVGGLYKGFFPNWARIGPHTVIAFIIFEKLRDLVGMRPV